MPVYRVTFERPVVYLPDHRPGERTIHVLDVHAPDEQAAIVHALRVTRGDCGATTAHLLLVQPHA